MNLRLPDRPLRGEPSLLPLINIVFLLLIFFMLAGIVSVHGPDGVELPRSDAESPARSTRGQLTLSRDGGLSFDGRIYALDALGPAVAAFQDAHPEQLVVVRADAALEADQLLTVVTALRRAGVSRVRILTRGPAPG